MNLHHRLDGPDGAPVLVLGPSLGTTLDLWAPQLPALGGWRTLRYDLPGHGGSPAPGAPFTVEDLADAVAALLDRYGIARAAYAGVSLGGAVGTALALAHPARVASLVLCCTSPRFGPPEPWLERAALVRREGTGPVADSAAQRWFTPAFGGAAPYVAMLRAADPEGYAACCEALARFDATERLAEIEAPTLVVAGAEDGPTPPRGHADVLAGTIPGAGLLVVQNAGHLANVERPGPVTGALTAHLDRTWKGLRPMDPAPAGAAPADPPLTDDERRHAAGMAVRREVLGDAHVDGAVARTTGFTADFQDLITRYAWGEIWTRPGLDRRTRSCVTLTAMVAGGHLDELAMHVRAALRNGLTRDEIKEVLLQTAVYCGVPAANSAFAVAQRVLAEEG
ncbi:MULTISPECIES: 3-oxoadipate enol-lactonase [Actinomadura]|uniref:3-oxoadipate enol-lactonase n=1 Tax=Actinomadura yumaensis TaxID=111807 RepID=A0ABW2CV63_9ACTN|nr:3-oxoadipate enol-lactonase [Actinomadura sp. J1-007]MWK39534.1 3-oxoadipate enol-lactonase [Actinomadura sp. J1-007]